MNWEQSTVPEIQCHSLPQCCCKCSTYRPLGERFQPDQNLQFQAQTAAAYPTANVGRHPIRAQCALVEAPPDTSLCLKSCVIMSSNNDSRLANEFARSVLRRFAPQVLPPKQMELPLPA